MHFRCCYFECLVTTTTVAVTADYIKNRHAGEGMPVVPEGSLSSNRTSQEQTLKLGLNSDFPELCGEDVPD